MNKLDVLDKLGTFENYTCPNCDDNSSKQIKTTVDLNWHKPGFFYSYITCKKCNTTYASKTLKN